MSADASPAPPERVLAVVAHPDDLDFGAGGTVATWVAAGSEVSVLVVTAGDAGGFDDTPRDQMPILRRREQEAASAELGVTDVRWLDGYADGAVEPTPDLVRDVSRVIRQVRPQLVLTSSPERWWDRMPASHPDHMAVGEATTRAVYPAARNAFAFPELLQDDGLEPWTVPTMWLMAHPDRTVAVDITEVFDRKVAALRRHVSQTAHLGDGLETMLRGWSGGVAAEHGLPDGRLAEDFRVLQIP